MAGKNGMVIAVGSDHAGYRLKGAVAGALSEMGCRVLDMGTDSEESCVRGPGQKASIKTSPGGLLAKASVSASPADDTCTGNGLSGVRPFMSSRRSTASLSSADAASP